MTFVLASAIFDLEEMRDGTAQAWINVQDPDALSSVLQSQVGSSTVLITLISGEGIGNAYDSVLNLVKISEQAPLDQQALDERLFDGITSAQTSTEVTVLDKQRLTFFLNVDAGATGGTITIQAVNDDGDSVDVAFYEIGDVSSTKIASKVCTTGNYCFSLPEDLTFKKVTVTLGSYTNGTFTMDVWGGAL